MIVSEEIRKIFEYDKESGELIWRRREDMTSQWNGRMAGKVAGCLHFNKTGSRADKRISILDKNYQAARVIWAYHNEKAAPSNKYVGFIDSDPLNTRIENLYLTQNSESQMKRKANENRKEKHGFKGVYKKGNGFRAMITVNKKAIYLGYFNTPILAAEKYNEAAIKHFGSEVTLNEIHQEPNKADIF